MHLLPTHLAPLSDIADKRSTGSRFALTGIHLRVHGDNTFLAEATDTKVLLRVSGPCVAPIDEYPEHPGLKDAPNGSMEALIPATVWAKTFSSAAKTTKRQTLALRSVAVKMSKELATFGSTDLDSYPVDQTKLVEGRFPPAADIIDSTRKSAVRSFWVDPLQLSRALKALAAVGCDEDSRAVEIMLPEDHTKPFLIEAKRSDGVKSELIVMPLGEGPAIKPSKKEEDQPDSAAEVVRLREELGIVREQVENLKVERKVQEEEIEKVIADRDRLDKEASRARGEVELHKKDVKDLLRKNDALREELQTAIRAQCDQQAMELRPVGDSGLATLALPATSPRPTPLTRRERLQRIGA